jgi:ubiquinone/menaquinone biosynthesis C-methylase UbiE
MTNDAYKIAYRTIASQAGKSERSRAFGDEDIGQHSWTTPNELLGMIEACELNAQSRVLDVGCGAGGPAMFVTQQSGCQVTGLDIDQQGVNMANTLAIERGLSNRCNFHLHNATDTFDTPDASLDLIFAIDSIFHIPQRKSFLYEARRILNHRGRLFFTDAGVVNGQISGEEFQLRSFNGPAFYAPIEYNKAVLEETGFELLHSEDLTENNERIAQNRFDARVELRDSLIEGEGEAAYHGRQAYLQKVAQLCRERRLCRFSYLAKKAV